jgi:hypothetical protein
MAHTRSQEMESRFNTLQSSFLETQQEVKQLSATIASCHTSINTTINASMQSAMAEVKHELTTQLESVFASLCTKLKIPTDDPFPMHIQILKVKLLPSPIPFSPITFNRTYAFRRWM